MDKKEMTRTSKFISLILRHKPGAIKLDPHGTADLLFIRCTRAICIKTDMFFTFRKTAFGLPKACQQNIWRA